MRNIVDHYCHDAQLFFRDLALELGPPEDIELAMRVTRDIFHVLRDRIMPEQSMQLVSQLPMLLEGMYVDGWKITKARTESVTLEEFMNDLRSEDPAAGHDFANDEEAKLKIRAVFDTLRRYVDGGELRHLCAQLPSAFTQVII